MRKKYAKFLGTGKEFNYYYGNFLGNYEGFDITIHYDSASLLYNMYFTVKGSDDVEKLNDVLAKIDKYAVAKYKNNILTITEACDKISDMPFLVNKLLETLIPYLKKNKYSNLCSKCNGDIIHSHRYDGIDSGRNIALICMTES